MPAMGRHRRLLRHAALAVALALLAALAFAATAPAAVPVLRGSFTCSVGTPCGSVTSMNSGRIAVDEATGKIYVIDNSADAVLVFNSDGTYASQIPGSATRSGTFSFPGNHDDVAVDNSGGPNQGNVYVSSQNAGTTFAFDSSGNFLWEASGGFSNECGIAVDGSGNLYGMDRFNGIQQMDTSNGSFIGSVIPFPDGQCHFAFDSRGNIEAAQSGGEVSKFDPTGRFLFQFFPGRTTIDVAVDTSNDNVYAAVDIDGTQEWATDGTEQTGSPFGPFSTGVAVNSSSGTVYVSEGSQVEIYAPNTFRLSAAKDGTGTGGVTSDVGGIDCGATCSAQIDGGTTVTLQPTADTGSQFVTWTGCDSVVGDLCTVTVNADTTVTATFDLIPQHTLTVAKDGTGSGTVTSDVGGIDCGLTCDALFNEGDSVTLSASAATGSTFTGWSGGGCSGTADCVVSVNADTTVTATFAQNAPTVVTGAASSITQTGATVAGTVNPNGGNVTGCHVDYGTSASYGSQVACASLPGSGTSAAAVSAALSGLTAGTTYHYRVVATNAGGTTNGSDATFTTARDTCATNAALCPPPPPPPSSVLSLVARTAAVSSGKAAIKLACTGDTACTGTITLTAKVKVRKGKRTVTKSRKIGTATVNIAANGRATVKVKLSKAARSLLAKRHSLKATLTGPDLRTTVVLKQPAKKHKKK